MCTPQPHSALACIHQFCQDCSIRIVPSG
ncbi:hypothetical protein HPC62_13425 [Thermoleptolyngbya sichuanensis A183]|uniref:Uncharacterized protein n=1 Tax=Thermoleptolyngbya sichuanensis A183 TaxID=2737172 RepID=A0A6M8BL00_9CYAN|nr:hypothetical protein HPC62_13425 [Thermoleptolyngbya sichuanensis A183]